MDESLHDLLVDRGLLFFEEEGVRCHGNAADVEGVCSISWPWVAILRSDELATVGWFLDSWLDEAGSFNSNLSWAAVVLEELGSGAHGEG